MSPKFEETAMLIWTVAHIGLLARARSIEDWDSQSLGDSVPPRPLSAPWREASCRRPYMAHICIHI